MELKTFIFQTILEISEAIREINTSGQNINANPKINLPTSGQTHARPNKNLDSATIVHFDVCVTAQEKDTTDGKAGIKIVSVINFGGGIANETLNQSTSRIKFDIPVIFPRKEGE